MHTSLNDPGQQHCLYGNSLAVTKHKLLSSGQSLNIVYPYKAEELLQDLNSKGQLKKKKSEKATSLM